MKVYPGHLKTVQFEHVTHEETAPRFDGGFSFQTTGFMLNDNGPTHVDSFSHLDPDPSAQTIDQMALDLFYGTAVCLDVTQFAPQTDITAEDLDRIESDSPVEVRRGDIVLFHTATWNRYAGDKRYLSEFAGLGESASEWIVDRGVKTFGVDSPTPDNPSQHQLPLPHDVPPRAHHPLREPGQPRPGRQHPVHLRRASRSSSAVPTVARPGPSPSPTDRPGVAVRRAPLDPPGPHDLLVEVRAVSVDPVEGEVRSSSTWRRRRSGWVPPPSGRQARRQRGKGSLARPSWLTPR